MPKQSKSRRVRLYHETYRTGTAVVFDGIAHPRIPWIPPEKSVCKVELMAQGSMGDPENPEDVEPYLDVRIYIYDLPPEVQAELAKDKNWQSPMDLMHRMNAKRQGEAG